jgi:hypothetical protein
LPTDDLLDIARSSLASARRAQPFVAVKRMDGLKLDVRQRRLDQQRRFDRIVVQKFFQSAETFAQLIRLEHFLFR